MGWRDYRRIPVAIPTGATSIDLDPIEWIHRIKPHIPDPGRHCQKFYAAYSDCTRISVASEERKGTVKPAAGLPDRDDSDCSMQARTTWARLIKKSFEADLLLCPCGGRMRIVSFNTDPRVVDRFCAIMKAGDGKSAIRSSQGGRPAYR